MAIRARRLRFAGLILAVAASAVACGDTQTPPDDHYEADVALIEQLWQGFSDSWSGGREAGYAYVAAHDHPVLGCTEDDFAPYAAVLPDPFQWELDLYAGTIRRDDAWEVPGRDGALTVPQGRVYVHRGESTFTGDFATETRENRSHSAILDGRAVFFFPCRP